jgi:hypothetical protein
VAVGDRRGVSVALVVGVALRLAVDVGVLVAVRVGDALGVALRVWVRVRLGVAVGVMVRVGVAVRVGVTVALAVAVGVSVRVGVRVAVGVGLGVGVYAVPLRLSVNAPLADSNPSTAIKTVWPAVRLSVSRDCLFESGAISSLHPSSPPPLRTYSRVSKSDPYGVDGVRAGGRRRVQEGDVGCVVATLATGCPADEKRATRGVAADRDGQGAPQVAWRGIKEQGLGCSRAAARSGIRVAGTAGIADDRG